MGQLVWVAGAELAGDDRPHSLWCPDPAPVQVSKVRWERKLCRSPVPLTCRTFPPVLHRFAEFLCYVFYVLVSLLNLSFFFCAQGRRDLFPIPSVLSLPPAFGSIGGKGSRCYQVPCCVLSVCLCLPLFGSCSVSLPLFFTRNCSINSCDLVCSVVEVSSESPDVAILNQDLMHRLEVLNSLGFCVCF